MKLLGTVLSVVWCVVIAAAAWLQVNDGPSHGWLSAFIAQKHRDPDAVRLDGFGLFYQAIDPVHLLLAMVVPIACAWLVGGLVAWIVKKEFRRDKKAG